MDFYRALTAACPEGSIKTDEPMSDHTTFRIGGPADYFASPGSADELMAAMDVCKAYQVPYMVMGNGSNLLVGDKGFRGVIFCICGTMDEITVEESGDSAYITAGAGILLSRLARAVSNEGYEGFEFATGIPGTLGGGVTMNAGAYGGEIKDHLLYADVIDENGEVKRMRKARLDMSYRHSAVMDKGYIVLDACFLFKKGDADAINRKVSELSASRKEKQPIEYPSAGSTFKRPEGYFAGKLIEDSGLKGYSIGGAMVSEKHCGFVINKGGASAKDVKMLVDHIQKTVYEKFGVMLEPEIRFVGES